MLTGTGYGSTRKVETVMDAPGQVLRQRRLIRRSQTLAAIYDLGRANNTLGTVVPTDTTDAPANYLVVCENPS